MVAGPVRDADGSRAARGPDEIGSVRRPAERLPSLGQCRRPVRDTAAGLQVNSCVSGRLRNPTIIIT